MNPSEVPNYLKIERRPISRPVGSVNSPARRSKGKAIRADGITCTPELRSHYKIVLEARERSSTGQPTVIGARNVDAAAPVERYFNRKELDTDEWRNDRLFRAAQRLRCAYKDSNLEPNGVSNLMRVGSTGIPDRWATLRLDALRAYDRAIKSIKDPDEKSVVSFVVVYEAGHAKDWARLKHVPERGAIVLLRRGLGDLAVYYGLLKKPHGVAAIGS